MNSKNNSIPDELLKKSSTLPPEEEKAFLEAENKTVPQAEEFHRKNGLEEDKLDNRSSNLPPELEAAHLKRDRKAFREAEEFHRIRELKEEEELKKLGELKGLKEVMEHRKQFIIEVMKGGTSREWSEMMFQSFVERKQNQGQNK